MPAFPLSQIARGLPAASLLDPLAEVLSSARGPRRAVVAAPPGTGKTTVVPPAVANAVAASGQPGRTVVVAPRRVAARAARRRLQELSGHAVGLRIRGESHRGAEVEFVTPGVLVQQLLRQPDLPGVAAVVMDEVHERHLDADLALGMALELTELRPELALVAMSATAETERFSQLMGHAPVLRAESPLHPVAEEWAPHPSRVAATRRERNEFCDHLASLAVSALPRGSVLVFVPGVAEVERTLATCRSLTDAPVLPLHGRLSARDQDAALRPALDGRARIVVATAVAESALTVPGVRVVVDSGLSRVPRRDRGRGMFGLVTTSEARSTAVQRAGRAGREGPGLVIRALSSSEYRHLDAQPAPEITTADLTQAALWLACWGTPGGRGLPLLDAPPAAALAEAQEALERIGALTPSGRATQLGEQLAALPMDPRLGRALLECGPGAAPIVAELTDLPVERVRALAAGAPRPVDPGTVVALAFPHQVARRVAERTYLMASGTRATVPAELHVPPSSWLAVAEATRSRSRDGATVRAAYPVSEENALRAIGVTCQDEVYLDNGRVRGRRVRRAGAIQLSAHPCRPPREKAAALITPDLLPWPPEAQNLRARLEFLHARVGAPWPTVANADPEVWLAPELDRLADGADPARVDTVAALRRLLPWPEAARLDELAPERFAAPGGAHPPISYATGRPEVSVKLQECFGLERAPVIAGVPLLFHLLSPAGRDLAVTDDLAGFWRGAYQQVRAEMRGRYPKHPWPEDPLSATPTGRTARAARAAAAKKH